MHAGPRFVYHAPMELPNVIEQCLSLPGAEETQPFGPEALVYKVGGNDRDIQMAINAGVPRTVRILSHHEPKVGAEFTLAETTELTSLLREKLPQV